MNTHLLVTTSYSLLRINCHDGRRQRLHHGQGLYYGLSRSAAGWLVAARGRTVSDPRPLDTERGEILRFDDQLRLCERWQAPFPLRDIHEIAWQDDGLWVTCSFDNMIALRDHQGHWCRWYPLGPPPADQPGDVNHFNSFYFEPERVWVLAHNRGSSELLAFDRAAARHGRTTPPLERIALGVQAHNIWRQGEVWYTCSSAESRLCGSDGWQVYTGGFPRGIAQVGDRWVVGVSALAERQDRDDSTGELVWFDAQWRECERWSLPGEGLVLDVVCPHPPAPSPSRGEGGRQNLQGSSFHPSPLEAKGGRQDLQGLSFHPSPLEAKGGRQDLQGSSFRPSHLEVKGGRQDLQGSSFHPSPLEEKGERQDLQGPSFRPSPLEGEGSGVRGFKPAYLFALLTGLMVALYVFPTDFILGSAWLYEQGDFSQHISGWLFFRADGWQFPLLHTERLNAPEGVSIVFTDSIPLLALIFKLLDPLLPPGFHYFGLWHVLVVIGQAVAAVFLIRSLGCRQWYATLAAVVLALSAAVLPWRLGHSALMAHGLLLIGLGLYFRARYTPESPRRYIALLLLTALVGLLIHPYWYAMLFALYVVVLVDGVVAPHPPAPSRREGLGVRGSLLWMLGGLAATVGLMGVMGYGGSSMGASGYGLYSMNLLAPFCDGRLYSCYVDATGGQYEGFNYLGAGVLGLGLLLSAGWLVRGGRGIGATVRMYPALILLALGFTLYALSHRVYFGSTLLLEWPLPGRLEELFNIFRAGGRFFWLVGYLLTFVLLAQLIRHYRPVVVLLVLAVILPLQIWDNSAKWDYLMQRVRIPAEYDLHPWTEVAERVEAIHLHPAFGCAPAPVEPYWFFQRLAAHYELPIDTGYIARANLDCDAKRQVFEQPFVPHRLYVLADRNSPMPPGFRHALRRGQCHEQQGVLWCVAPHPATPTPLEGEARG